MKGLMIKDLKLMKAQKNFFLLILAVAVGMILFSEDVTFGLGFLTFVVSLFTLSTISYDEFDNGNAFLFSLPITRQTYVFEKYSLSLLLGGGSWIFATLLVLAAGIFRGTYTVSEIMLIALMILPVMILIQAIMIPFQLKFGGEKGRLAIIGVVGLLFILGASAVKLAEAMNVDLFAVINHLPTLSTGMLLAIVIAAALALLLVSVRISMGIMGKKEF